MNSYEKLLVMVHNDMLAKADAIVLLEGDGFNRLNKAAELYGNGYAPAVVFSGGITDYAYGSYPFEDCLPKLLELGIKREDVIHEGKSLNTKEQAINVNRLTTERGWERLILTASPGHQCRAYLTFLKNINPGIILMNAPCDNLSWFEKEAWGMRFDLLEQEQQRIEKYTAQGDLATVEEAINYQKWKEKQITANNNI
ncbi:MAG: YdcF family protein [Tannerella sp.]|jgi:uncharacterized SAM-binding protein YcdF (DUF218 family)|nr:YdcF family protein [Tannerella sp.]